MLILPEKQKKRETRTIKPWGYFEQLTDNQVSTVKLITIRKGERTSLQSHKLRSERWYILDGHGRATIRNDTVTIKHGDQLFIPNTVPHRLEATKDMRILEISFGLFQESDITRFEDDYGRVSNTISLGWSCSDLQK